MKAPWALAVVLLLAALVAALVFLESGDDDRPGALAAPDAAPAGPAASPAGAPDRAPPEGGRASAAAPARLAAAVNRLTVEVDVTGAEGEPLPDARAVRVGAPGEPVRADDAGRLRLAGARPWNDTWVVAAPGHAPAVLQRPRGGEVAALVPESPLEVEVVGADDGAPIEDARVARHFPRRAALEAAVEALLPGPRTGADGRARIGGLRAGRLPAALSVTAPGGTGVLVLDAAVRTGGAGLRVELPRESAALTLRVLDAEGGPVADRPVDVHYWGIAFPARTDAAGEVRFDVARADLPADEEGVPGVSIDLGGGRSWLAAGPSRIDDGTPVYFVHWVAPTGRVAGPAGAWELASATMAAALETESEEHYELVAFRAQPWPWEAFDWHGLAADGSFALATGWQGPQTCLLVRHAPTGVLALAERATPGEEHALEPPGLCRVALVRAEGASPRGWTLQLVPARPDGRPISYEFRPGATLGLEELGDVVDVPRGAYVATLARGGATLDLGLLDAAGETARLELAIPGQLALSGSLGGLLSGPRPSVPLLFFDEQGRELARAVAGSDGEFAVELLASHPVRVEVRWPDWVKWGVFDPDVFRWRGWTAPGEARVEVVRDEARLVVTEDPASPLAGRYPVTVEPYSPEGDRSGAGLEAKTLAAGEEWRLLLPPGEFLVAQSVGPLGDGELAFSQRVTLTAGGTETVVVEGSQQTLLDLVVSCPFELTGELQLDVRDATDWAPVSQPLLVHGRRGEERHGFLVDPGEYTVTLTGRLEPRLEGAEPLDVAWSGGATCTLGQRTTLAIDLAP